MNNNINWEEVEKKIAIICNKFNNISEYREDLEQELRIHAYYKSDDYYNLYRRAIDFWRRIQYKADNQTPYFDLDVLGVKSKSEDSEMLQFDDIISMIKKELERPGINKWEDDSLEVARKIFEMIIVDIDPRKEIKRTSRSDLNHYINQRINLSWVYEETDISYKRLRNSMKLIEDIVKGLAVMGKIDIPREYFSDYFDK